jgi:hypothetical protein
MNWETLYCPNRHCRYYGVPFPQAMPVKNGSSHGHPLESDIAILTDS